MRCDHFHMMAKAKCCYRSFLQRLWATFTLADVAVTAMLLLQLVGAVGHVGDFAMTEGCLKLSKHMAFRLIEE